MIWSVIWIAADFVFEKIVGSVKNRAFTATWMHMRKKVSTCFEHDAIMKS